MKSNTMTNIRRITASMLALLMILAYLPVIGQSAYAADKDMIQITPEQAEKLGIELEEGKDYSKGIYISQKDADTAGFEAEDAYAPDEPQLVEAESVESNELDLTKIPVVRKSMKLNGDGSYYPVDDDSFSDDNDDSFEDVKSGSSYPVITPGADTKGSIESDDDTATYMFTAPADGAYSFYSGNSDEDIKGRIVTYDSETSTLRQWKLNDDIDYPANKEFRITFKAKAGVTYYMQAKFVSSGDTGNFHLFLEKDEYAAQISVELDKATGKAKVTGTAQGDTFNQLYVDDRNTYADIEGLSSFSVQIDMKEFPVGIHEVFATLENHSDQIFYENIVPTYVYAKPSIKLDEFYNRYNYISYYYSGSSYKYDSDCDVYLQYKKKGGSWNSDWTGPISTNSGYRNIPSTKLKASTAYTVRTVFGVEQEYGGQKYFISGADTGKYSNTKTVKTASKKLAIKRVKISSVKQYSRKVRKAIWSSYWNGSYITYYISGYKWVKEWYTSFKATVYLKKKPGVKGIYIGSVKCKGDKKSYSAKFNLSGKKKGKKLKFSFVSYQSTKYSSYSPYSYKKVKI